MRASPPSAVVSLCTRSNRIPRHKDSITSESDADILGWRGGKTTHRFDAELFVLVLLPMIIFEAGYSLDKRGFFTHLASITTFAILGTLLSTLLIAPVILVVARNSFASGDGGGEGLLGLDPPPFSMEEALAFSALISAVRVCSDGSQSLPVVLTVYKKEEEEEEEGPDDIFGNESPSPFSQRRIDFRWIRRSIRWRPWRFSGPWGSTVAPPSSWSESPSSTTPSPSPSTAPRRAR
jgi:hypothetical protein